MGQQQLLLIILGVIVVGIAVAVGITMFSDNAVNANQYYRRPTALGGGGNSFVGLTADAAGLSKLTNMPGGANANGTYSITTAGTANQVTVQGVGTETAPDGNKVTQQIFCRDAGRPDSLVVVH